MTSRSGTFGAPALYTLANPKWRKAICPSLPPQRGRYQKKVASRFPEEGSGLQRYASVFDGVEINSTLYRRHKTSTFARWAGFVPDGFRFSVKMPKEISHRRAMIDVAEPFCSFIEDIAPLGEKRGPLLCQLPPS
jgi:uncharacterized protein YecE (DUF72 family)